MKKVENSMFVSVAYKGSLEKGDVFNSNHGRRPLETKIGAGQLLK